MRALDTSQAAARAQILAYRSMTPEARLGVGLELTRTGRDLLAAGVRKRHHEYSDAEVRLATIRLWLGAELFRRVYSDKPELEP